jgi:hypothetical protein
VTSSSLDDRNFLGQIPAQAIEPLYRTIVDRTSLSKATLPKPELGAGAKAEPKPASPVPEPVFPKLSVPYQDTATNLCDLYLDFLNR